MMTEGSVIGTQSATLNHLHPTYFISTSEPLFSHSREEFYSIICRDGCRFMVSSGTKGTNGTTINKLFRKLVNKKYKIEKIQFHCSCCTYCSTYYQNHYTEALI